MAGPLSQLAARCRRALIPVLGVFLVPIFLVAQPIVIVWELRRWLFAVAGRVPRYLFWISLALLAGYAQMVAMFIDLATVDGGGSPGWRGTLWLVLIVLPVAAVIVTVSIRRLHDRGKTAWWLLLFYGTPAGLLVASGATPLPALVTGVGAMILLGWAVIELGFRRGSAGANRFGPDPSGQSSRVS